MLLAMSYFSAALDSIMRQRGMKQAQLGRDSQIDQAQISRYLSGDNRPDGPALERLCLALTEDSASLLLGYVRDEIPAFARDRIDVISLSKASAVTGSPSQPDAYSRLSARARKLLNEFATRCESSPALVNALDSMLDLTRRGLGCRLRCRFGQAEFCANALAVMLEPLHHHGDRVLDIDVFGNREQGPDVFQQAFVRAQGFLLAAPRVVQSRRLYLDDLRPAELHGEDLINSLQQRQRENPNDAQRAVDRRQVGQLQRLRRSSHLVAETSDFVDVPLVRDSP